MLSVLSIPHCVGSARAVRTHTAIDAIELHLHKAYCVLRRSLGDSTMCAEVMDAISHTSCCAHYGMSV